MTDQTPLDRRRFVRLAGSAASIALVAGCGGPGQGDNGTDAGAQTEAGPDEVQAWMRELTATRKEATRATPAWHEAADAVELAKHLSGALWEQAPGRVRLEGVRP